MQSNRASLEDLVVERVLYLTESKSRELQISLSEVGN